METNLKFCSGLLLAAICSITGIEVYALRQGIDGTALSAAIGAVCWLGGALTIAIFKIKFK